MGLSHHTLMLPLLLGHLLLPNLYLAEVRLPISRVIGLGIWLRLDQLNYGGGFSRMSIQFKLNQSEFFPRISLTDAGGEECDGACLEFQLSGDRGGGFVIQG